VGADPGEANVRQAKAVAALLNADLKPVEVAELLGIELRQVRTLKAAAREADTVDKPAVNGKAKQTEAAAASAT